MPVEQVQQVLRRDGYYRVLEEGEERKLVSVTTVLQTLNKPALVTWAAKTAAGLVLDDPETFSTADAAAQGIYGVTENATSRGSTIHQIAQSIFEGQEVELIPKHVTGYIDALKAWVKDAEPEVICTERTLVNLEEGYAGTTDLICRIGGAVWIVDFKRLALDTVLPTPTGSTTMKDVQIGDRLLDEQGRPCNVTGKSEIRWDEDCYRIKFRDGSSVVAGAGHPWQVINTVRGKTHIVSTLELEGKLRRHGSNVGSQNHWAISVAQPLDLPEQELLIDPYVLGVWLGDGSADGDSVTTIDPEMIAELEDRGYRASSTYRSRHGVPTYYFPELRARTEELGLHHNKHIPDVYLRASLEQRQELLQGLMDTDGTVCRARQNRVSIVSTIRPLACGIRDLICGLGMRTTFFEGVLAPSKTKPERPYWVLEYLPTLPVFKLPRKASLIGGYSAKRLNWASRRVIRSVEKVPSVPTACVEVDSPSHLYLCTESFIPTHNTGKRVYDEAALQLAAYKGCLAMLEDGVLIPAPEIEQTAVLLLKESGKYQFSWVDAPLDVFVSLKRVWEWTRS